MHTIRFWLFLLLVAQAAIGPGVVAQGQDVPSPGDTDVIGTSFIVRPYDTEVVAYASTELGYTLQDYYDGGGYVVLTSDGASQYGTLGQGGEVDGTLTASLGASDYLVTATHYVIPDVYTEDSSGTIYMNPYFSGSWGSGSCTLGDGQGGPDSCLDVEAGGFDETAYGPPDEIDIGTTSDEVSGVRPTISSISDDKGMPVSGVLRNTTGTLEIHGNALAAGGADTSPQVLVSGSGLSMSVTAVTDTMLTVGYTAGGNVGTYNITVKTIAGTSDPLSGFVVGDPQPTISSVCEARTGTCAPSPWQAAWGQFSITITGQGFGTSPQLSISGGGATLVSYSPQNDTTMTATVSPNTVGGVAEITVGSQGYSPCGGLSSCWVQVPGTPSTSSEVDVQVDPVPTLPPIIAFRDTLGVNGCVASNIAGSTQNVVVGQRIAFTGCLPAGTGATQESWTPNIPDQTKAVAGWSPSTGATAAPTQVSATNCGNTGSCDFGAFYFVVPNSNPGYKFTFSYTPANGGPAMSSSVTFNVTGPTATGADGKFFTAVPGAVNIWPAGVAGGGKATVPYLEFGNAFNNNGMTFTATAATPDGTPGAFQWVQVITSRNVRYLSAPATAPIAYAAGLDNHYPYEVLQDAPNTTNDSPGIPLNPTGLTELGEAADAFGATMYLMWDPAIAGTEQPSCAAASTIQNAVGQITSTRSTCSGSVPVPLAYVNWGYSGDAINTLAQNPTQTTWLLSCPAGAPPVPAVQNSASYPKWDSLSAKN